MKETFKSTKKSLGKEGRKVLDDGLSERSEKLRKALKAIEDITEYHGTGSEWGKKTAESVNQYNAAMEDLKKKYKKKGSF